MLEPWIQSKGLSDAKSRQQLQLAVAVWATVQVASYIVLLCFHVFFFFFSLQKIDTFVVVGFKWNWLYCYVALLWSFLVMLVFCNYYLVLIKLEEKKIVWSVCCLVWTVSFFLKFLGLRWDLFKSTVIFLFLLDNLNSWEFLLFVSLLFYVAFFFFFNIICLPCPALYIYIYIILDLVITSL